ncbi:hypothetical protein HY604_03995 [Candidatus Peregrinibacteria bacterium]|nr:hypothetical protein [Candidatus Peregrinibacteria bacterium]
MSTENAIGDYSIDRKAASRLLKVSIRTLDRYVSSKKLSTRLVDGRIWLDRNEIGSFGDVKMRHVVVDNVDMSTPEMSIDNNVDIVSPLSTTPRKTRGNKALYKKLFQDLRDELHEKQERLEIANYRVGQLEAQVRNSIPLLEYHRDTFERDKQNEDKDQKLNQAHEVISAVTTQLKYEKFNKRIFLSILLVILALQPLWLLLLYK